MRARQRKVLEAIHRVENFLNAHAATVSKLNESTSWQALKEIGQQLAAFEADQRASTPQLKRATKTIKELRRVLLRDHMAPIAAIARTSAALQRLRQEPAPYRHDAPLVALHCLRMPTASELRDDRSLAAHANLMAQIASHVRRDLIDAGARADAIERLEDLAVQLKQAAEDRARQWGVRREAAYGLERLTKKGKALIGTLRTLVAPRIRQDPELVKEWEAAARIYQRPRREGEERCA